MQLFIHVVCVYVCIHTLSVYGITYTTLGNTGHNSKLMQHDDYTQVQHIVKGIGTGVQYRNNVQVRNALEQYAITKFPIETYWVRDIKGSLVNAEFLTDKNKNYKNVKYDEIPNDKLQYYINELGSIKNKDVSNKKVFTTIGEANLKYMDIINKKRADFVTEALDYLVQQGTLSVQPNTAVANTVSDANDINNIVRNEPEHTALTTEINSEAHAVSANAHSDVAHAVDTAINTNIGIKNTVRNEPVHTALTNTQVDIDSANEISTVSASAHSDVAHAVDTGVTDTAIDTSADITNDMYTKFNKFMSMLKLTQHKIPIAILSTVLGIGTIGGAYYATGSTDALDTIGSDTDTEVLNDTNDTAQRHGVCIATITACTVLLALCTTTAYWIVCKQQQHDITYTAIGMMQLTNI